ncbi:hypothetical protein EDD11_006332 [Mortierella claussenii]|nr:hypothetical protein EDD11_006332 [Mortierella claussenii]
MSDNGNNDNSSSNGVQAIDPVHQLLQGGTSNGNPGQPMTAEQRNERREALLKRQRESREKAQQISQAARANAANGQAVPVSAAPTATDRAASVSASSATNTNTPTAVVPAPASVAAIPVATAPVADVPVRENMVQQAVSFLSSPSVQSADESKKIQFLEKKGLTTKEIELAKARVAGKVGAPVVTQPQQQQQQQLSYQQPAPVSTPAGPVPPPVPPRNYAPTSAYPQSVFIPQQQVASVDPQAFKKKLVIAMLISGGVTVLASIIVQKLIYPMVRGITGARQKLAVSQTELLAKLKERLTGYKAYLLNLHLGSNRVPVVKTIKDTKTTVEEEAEETEAKVKETTIVTTPSAATTTATSTTTYQSTVRQLDAFSKKLGTHANNLSFEELKATRAMTQDLAEYITKETYALTSSIAYPTSRYYGYNTAGAAASGKGGLSDPTTPESALKSEIRSLKGLLLNWRNFPIAKEASALPNLVQQQ